MTTATHVALVAIAGHLFYAFGTLGPSLDSANRGWAAATALREVRRIPVEVDGPGFAIALSPPRAAITFEDVDFRYPTRAGLALRSVAMRMPEGSFIGVVGPTGSGKSTIMKLLLRLYDPTAGTIRIDGTDIRRFDRTALRGLIGSVDQQGFVFEDTIAENIAVGRAGATVTDIRDAAGAALLGEFVETFPTGMRRRPERGAPGCPTASGRGC